MKEYWINVYDDYDVGQLHRSRKDAEYTSKLILELCEAKTIYRIHVRLK